MENKKQQLRQIARLSDVIREKYNSIKLNKMTTEEIAKEVLEPVVVPLKKLVDISENKLNSDFMNKEKVDVKIEPQHAKPNVTEMPNVVGNDQETLETNETESDPEWTDENDNFNSNRNVNDSSNKTLHKNTLEYYLGLVRRKSAKVDTSYGVRVLKSGLKIGNHPVRFKDGFIHIGNNNYVITKGLLELIFKVNPNTKFVTTDDFTTYKEIILSTNAHKKNYKANEEIRSKFIKFKKLIGPLLQSKTGGGIPKYLVYNNRKIDYIYWDDPNELVDRLRVLMAFQAAGNTSHANEIISIIEELKEANYIY